MKVLFVCTGNTCRSVMAEILFNRRAAALGPADWEARSAGLAADRALAIPAGVHAALRPRGIASIDHVPQPVTAELLDWADSALAMTRAHRDALQGAFPRHRAKIRLLLEAAGLGGGDVDDPIGQPDAVYAGCRDLIEKALEGLFRRHAPSTANPRP